MPTATQIVLCNCPDDAVAQRLAAGLVEQGLAACVNILPGVRSVYRWEGKVEQASEVSLLIKTTGVRYPAVEQYIEQQHPYDVPEIIAIPIAAGLPAYMEWLEEACR